MIGQCEKEDRRGVLCKCAAGHKGGCRFDWQPTERQYAILARAAEKAFEDFGGGGPAAAGLEKAGLISRWPLGMRWWRISITPFGFAVHLNAPR